MVEFKIIRSQVGDKGQTYWNVSDICKQVGIANARDAMRDRVRKEDRQKFLTTDVTGRNQYMNYVNKFGFLDLVMVTGNIDGHDMVEIVDELNAWDDDPFWDL